jgi:thiol-disulfide isomerase/thioredoxin
MSTGGTGFGSGLMVGAGLGLVYAPCAGPILAGVITVSAAQSFSAGRLAVAFAYGIGSAAALYLLLRGGRRLTARLSQRSGRFQMAMGVMMVLVAALMLGDYDVKFEAAIARHLPSFLVSPTRGLETGSATRNQLAGLHGGRSSREGGVREAASSSRLPVLGTAPHLTGTQQWFNTPGGRPLTLAQLRGRVVLIDFWTYSCINCLRTLPYLEAWDKSYRGRGLTIIGVHTPEFPFEHSADNVRAAIEQNGIHYPVVQDNDYATWKAYANQYWPAEYLIDARGRLRLIHFGEGEYAAKERAIRALLAEAGATNVGPAARPHAEGVSAEATTPESYLGSGRAERFANGRIRPGTRDFGRATRGHLKLSALRYAGRWAITSAAATAGSGARLDLRFHARNVFLVLGSPGRPRAARVLLDGKPLPQSLAGADVHRGVVRVEFQRLYRLVQLPRAGTHTLTILPDAGIAGYAFTFG